MLLLLKHVPVAWRCLACSFAIEKRANYNDRQKSCMDLSPNGSQRIFKIN